MNKKYQYVFGPVASRRLGVSLGVDLVKPKCCSLDCIYCEAGKTTDLTQKRREYVDCNAVCAELEDFLSSRPQLDFITFSGAGEPTLNSGIGRVLSFIKTNYPEYKVCLLTNALGFQDKKLLEEIAQVDLCVPSLDASNADEFLKINRPVSGIKYEDFLQALIDYTQHAEAEVVLELFIVPGINDSDASIRRFAQIISQMKLAKVQLNTLDRPGTEKDLQPSSPENTRRFIEVLEPLVPVEAVGPFKYKSVQLCKDIKMNELGQTIINLVRRRPATLADLALACQTDEKIIKSELDALLASGIITSERKARGEFFAANLKH